VLLSVSVCLEQRHIAIITDTESTFDMVEAVFQFDDVGVRGTGFSSHGSKVKCAVKKPELERPGSGALLSKAHDDIIIIATEEEEHVFYLW